MKEITFINQNIDRWKKLEKSLTNNKRYEPEQIANLFVQFTDDLAYARTYFPNSDITQYLNGISLQLHHKIYRNQKEDSHRFTQFWVRELPMEMYKIRKYLLYSFLIFIAAVTIGWVSQKGDASFSRLIMGDTYVNMTIENVEQGDPMAVYKQMNKGPMFLQITLNNIKVAFLAFMAGLFSAVGTGVIMLQNGIMLGSFQAFFSDYGLLWQSAKVIWIHGALEISAIIIAGAAGITLGNSIVFPGSYPRMYSFKNGVKTGMKVAIGLVPVFITAGFLEGFVTRNTDMRLVSSLFIIISSFTFIIWYFVIYPHQVVKKHFKHAGKQNKF